MFKIDSISDWKFNLCSWQMEPDVHSICLCFIYCYIIHKLTDNNNHQNNCQKTFCSNNWGFECQESELQKYEYLCINFGGDCVFHTTVDREPARFPGNSLQSSHFGGSRGELTDQYEIWTKKIQVKVNIYH